MIDIKTIEQVKELLIPLANKLGEAAQWGWIVIMRQVYVDAIISTVWCFILSLILVFFIIFIIKIYKNENIDEDISIPVIGIGIPISLIIIFFMCCNLSTAISHFINPEYYAIKEILNLKN